MIGAMLSYTSISAGLIWLLLLLLLVVRPVSVWLGLMGTPVSRDQLEPGDLVFFDGLGHNGIYIGGGQFIHSPHTGDVVKISSLSAGFYTANWVGARRLS